MLAVTSVGPSRFLIRSMVCRATQLLMVARAVSGSCDVVDEAEGRTERLADPLQVRLLDLPAVLAERAVDHVERQGVARAFVVLPGPVVSGEDLLQRTEAGPEVAPAAVPQHAVHLRRGGAARPGPRHRQREGDARRRYDGALARELRVRVREEPLVQVDAERVHVGGRAPGVGHVHRRPIDRRLRRRRGRPAGRRRAPPTASRRGRRRPPSRRATPLSSVRPTGVTRTQS